MVYLLSVLMTLCLLSCSLLEPTSILVTEELVVVNIHTFDTDNDEINDLLLIEYYRNNAFDKVLVYNKQGKFIGQILQIEGQWIFKDVNGNIIKLEKDLIKTLQKV